jgi:hypothetical protein
VTVDVKATSESNVSGNVCYYSSITTPFTNFNLPVTVALFSCKIIHGFPFHQLITTITVHELGTPGLKGILCIPFPYQKSAKVIYSFLF